MVKSKHITAPELAVGKLTGRSASGHKGILDTLLAKKELLHAIHKHAMDNRFEPILVRVLLQWCDGAHRYRDDMGYPSDTIEKDITWVGTLKPSSEQLLRLAEDRGLHAYTCRRVCVVDALVEYYGSDCPKHCSARMVVASAGGFDVICVCVSRSAGERRSPPVIATSKPEHCLSSVSTWLTCDATNVDTACAQLYISRTARSRPTTTSRSRLL